MPDKPEGITDMPEFEDVSDTSLANSNQAEELESKPEFVEYSEPEEPYELYETEEDISKPEEDIPELDTEESTFDNEEHVVDEDIPELDVEPEFVEYSEPAELEPEFTEDSELAEIELNEEEVPAADNENESEHGCDEEETTLNDNSEESDAAFQEAIKNYEPAKADKCHQYIPNPKMKWWQKLFTLFLSLCLAITFSASTYYSYSDETAGADTLPESIYANIDPSTILQPSGTPGTLQLDWLELLKKYPHIVAWIYIPGTDLSFPVVYGETNWYYLTHDATDSYSYLGAIFVGEQNSPTFTDFNTFIYGHTVEYIGGMFTNLKYWADKDFYQNHQVFYLLTPTTNYVVTVELFAETEDNSDFFVLDCTDEALLSVNKNRKEQAMYYSGTEEGMSKTYRYITLSTCSLKGNSKYVLQGQLHYMQGDVPL